MTLLLTALLLQGPMDAEEAARKARVPEGFHVSLFAAEPDVVQPIGMSIDDRGRVWVAEAHAYPEWQPEGNDRIVILEDVDGDGRHDKRTVFYDKLNYVTGIETGFGGVWVVSPPSFYFIPDRDGDDRPDGPPELLLDGFGHKHSQHNMVNGFTWGPDGWLYAGHGRTAFSHPGKPGTPMEGRKQYDGGVWRWHPVRRVFESWADGTTNPWGVDFDAAGQAFVSNCVTPHLYHMVQGGHYEPWRGRESSLYAYQRIPSIADHRHFKGQNLGRKLIGSKELNDLGGGHAHCGTLVYGGDSYPEEYRGRVMMVNVHGRRINQDLLRRSGSTYVASHGPDFFVAADPWFMGTVLRTGPDGSVFVTDWNDTGECHTRKPHRQTGRIFKIAYGEKRAAPLDLAKLSDPELVKLQLHRNEWHVRRARRLLQERAVAGRLDASVRPALEKILSEDTESTHRLRALWALKVIGAIDEAKRLALMDDREELLRAWAVQLELEDREAPPAAREKMAAMAAKDPSPVVGLYLAAAVRRLPPERRWDILEGLVGRAEFADDTTLPLLVWYAAEPLAAVDAKRALKLVAGAKLPHAREFMARRIASLDH